MCSHSACSFVRCVCCVQEKLEECLLGLKQSILTDMRLHPTKVALSKDLYFRKLLDAQKDIGRALHYFLVTGNLVSSSGLDMMQVSGYTIVAEKLNYFRYLSHFRSVHRGQFFTTMKTTEVRKLLPESFGSDNTQANTRESMCRCCCCFFFPVLTLVSDFSPFQFLLPCAHT